jgi:hypothetical protein
MPRTAAAVTYADFIANSDAAAVLETLAAAPNRDAVVTVYQELTGKKVPPTAFYNLAKSLEAIRDGKSYAAGAKEYGNPTGETDYSKLTVPMQGGLEYSGLNTLTAAFADRGKDIYPAKSNGNGGAGNGTPAAAPAPDAPSTPVTSASGPAPVDPVLLDTVQSLRDRFAAEDAAAPLTGRAFLEMMWNETPEEERNRRVNAIARSFVEARESGSHRGSLRTLIDNLAASLKGQEGWNVPADLDIWTYIYANVMDQNARSESYEQIKSNLRNAYRFDPDAAMFKDWESAIAAQAAAFVEMFGKDLGVSVETVAAKSALKRTREALDSIHSGMLNAQKRFEEWETRNLRSATPPPPVLDKLPFASLPESVQSALGMPQNVWDDILTADQQRTALAQRSIVQVDGVWTTAADRKKDEGDK